MLSATLWKLRVAAECIGVLLVVCVVAQTNAQTFPDASNLQRFMQQTYGQLLLKYSAELKKNPLRSTACFRDYTPKLAELTKQLEAAHNTCQRKHEAALAQVPKTVARQRANLTNTVAVICNKFTECSLKERALDFFRCYECTANEGINVAHWMRLNAGEGAKLVQISFDVIDFEKTKCANACNIAFLNSNSELQKELDTCINGEARCPGKDDAAAAKQRAKQRVDQVGPAAPLSHFGYNKNDEGHNVEPFLQRLNSETKRVQNQQI